MGWRERFCEIVGGKRFTHTWCEHPLPVKPYWLAAVACRFVGHALDGRESGSGGTLIDLWCSRCFYFQRSLHPSEVPWYRHQWEQLVSDLSDLEMQ